MFVRLSREFTFEAAHLIPTFPEGHKCRRLHGHSFRVEIVVAGDMDPKVGYLVDFAELKARVSPAARAVGPSILERNRGT